MPVVTPRPLPSAAGTTARRDAGIGSTRPLDAATAPASATAATAVEPAANAPFAPVDVSGTPTHPVSSSASVLLRGAQLGGVDAALVKTVDSARAAVDARLAAGFDPAYPPGDVGGLLPMGGSFGVRLSGGANHALGSLVVVDPASGNAHHVTHGFGAFAQQPVPELGGRPAIDALGAPLEAERSIDQSHAVQRFTHGELHWSPSRGVWVEPGDLFARRASSLPAPTPRTDLSRDDAERALARDLGHALSHTKKSALQRRELELCACDATLPQRLRDACASLVDDVASVGAQGITKRSLASRALSTWLAPMTFQGEKHQSYFVEWALKQVAHNPVIAAVHDEVRALLESPARPTRMNELYDAARAMAAKHLDGDPRLQGDERAHVVNVSALVAMAAHALKNNHSGVVRSFPPFLWDGRSTDAACDKAWHFTNHAMMAYVSLYDSKHGDGTIRRDMALAVDKADEQGVAQRVAKTYDERRGALGSFVSQVLDGPSDQDPSSRIYAGRPAGMSDDESKVYDMTVRIGDAHEYLSSGDSFPVALDDVGDDSTRFDPLAMVASRFGRVWGLQDYGVARDLTANRLGAAFAVGLFRAPATDPVIPHDDGKSAATAPFASVDNGGRAIPFAHYAAHEGALVAILRGTLKPEDAAARFSALVDEAGALGKDAANARVEGEVLALVDELLASGDHERLASYYGSFAARHLRWGERLEGFSNDADGFFSREPTKHRDWALWSLQNGKGADVRTGFATRLKQTFAST